MSSILKIQPLFTLLLLLCLLEVGSPNYALGEGNTFMGTGSCSSSNCHGSSAPRTGSNVLQNEYPTWFKHGQHSKAWQVLTNAEGKKIGRNLGMSAPENEPLCLECHATYVKNVALRGKKYSVEDGVSCESCHGASEKWLSSHTSRGANREESIARGMKDIYPIEARAKLCLSCHYGTEEKTVNHRLIGAGHPRLSFELDTFSMIQPRHWVVDADYEKRKGTYSAAKAWLIGQVVLSSETMSALASEKRSHSDGHSDGWPELSLFNCYACHHSLTSDQWKVRDYAGKPGIPRLNVSSLQMVVVALEVLKPELSKELSQKIEKLHDAVHQGSTKQTATEIKSLLDGKVLRAARGVAFSSKEVSAVLKQLVQVSAERSHYQYEEAEQIVMAISSMLASDAATGKKHQDDQDKLYHALRNPEEFVAEEFTEASRAFRKGLS